MKNPNAPFWGMKWGFWDVRIFSVGKVSKTFGGMCKKLMLTT